MDLDLPSALRILLRLPVGRPEAARRRLECLWAPDGDGLAFVSVRSAFDATLTALDWPPGTEVLMSAVNISDMATLLRLHGLVPVALPMARTDLVPTADAVERACTPRTRGLLLAHLFGAQAQVDSVFRHARGLGLVGLEDAAQAFSGLAWRGSAEADVTYFSFGTIKTATALGGALVRVASPELRARMGAVEASWPLQSRRTYAGKAVRALLFLLLQTRLGYSSFSAGCRALGVAPGEVVRGMARGFGGLSGDALLAALRRRPCAPLLHTLNERLTRPTTARVGARSAWGREVAAGSDVPGSAHAAHGHWLLPVYVRDADATRAALREVGVDASGTSNVVAMDDALMTELTRRWVFVPAYPELPPDVRARVLAVLRKHGGP
jgi:hypothetical protein